MSSFWSWFIGIITIANILACFWLIRWTAKPRPNEGAATDTTGHVWDEDLTEYNKPMPRWWLNLFYITIFFSLGYLVLFPGLGNFDGVLGWSQVSAYEEEVKEARAEYAEVYEQYAQTPIPQLAQNASAMATGQRIFANNCAVCHGSDARGASGFPNLADDSWLYGNDPEQIKQSILYGRKGVMPAFGAALGTRGLEEVSAYVFSLNGREAPQAFVQAGADKFQQLCVSCHGQDGKGNNAVGAPNLTDDAWLYGGSLESIKTTLRNGRQGRMPAQKKLLGEERVHVVSAYVYSLSAMEDGVQ